jgi:NAD(P)-dependent dehydrogenase (short-subunit alcohol dehydrogenase family)
MDGELSGRHVVVTGGTGALGAAIVGKLLGAGATCAIPCASARERERFAFRGHGSVRLLDGIDLTDESAVERFYAWAVAEGRPPAAGRGGAGLWASLHIAGAFSMSPVEATSRDDFVKLMQTNALTCFLCCREAVKRMKAEGSGEAGGRIVNVAARPALEPRTGAGMVAYTASKSAVAAMTAAMAEELAQAGILVNAVAPSIMDTPANRAAMPQADHAKWPKVDEVAEAIAWLVSPRNTVTRGAVVTVYGKS